MEAGSDILNSCRDILCS